MSDSTKNALGIFAIGVIAVVVLSLGVYGAAMREERERRQRFEKEAIQHGAGTYDRETGEFVWKEQP